MDSCGVLLVLCVFIAIVVFVVGGMSEAAGAPSASSNASPPPNPPRRRYKAGDRVRVVGLSDQRLEYYNRYRGDYPIENGMTGTVHVTEYDTGGYQGRPVYVHLDSYGAVKMYSPFKDDELAPE